MRYQIQLYTSANPDLTFTFDATQHPGLDIHDAQTLANAVLEELPDDCDAVADFHEAGLGMLTCEDDSDDELNTRKFVYYGSPADEDSEGEIYLVTVTPV